MQQRGRTDQIQRVPTADSGKSKAAAGKFDPLIGMYTVAAGDLLSKIADRFATTVEAIRKNNPDIKDVDKVAAGQKTFLPDLIMPLDPTGMTMLKGGTARATSLPAAISALITLLAVTTRLPRHTLRYRR